MKKTLISISLLMLASMMALPAQAKTHKTAKVNVFNYSKNTIKWVSVVHKYSDVYKNNQTWVNLPPNTQTFPNAMTVDYNTGFGTTGQDWWMVAWEWNDQACVTNPNNFRGIIDGIEGALSANTKDAAEKLGEYVGTFYGGAKVGEKIGSATGSAGDVLSKALFNSESTVGFKKHFLENKDAGGIGVYMDIYGDGRLRINSPSGTSWTVYKCSPIFKFPPLPVAAVLYSDINFGGKTQNLTIGFTDYQNLTAGNDSASSIRIRAGYKAIIYEDANRQGKSISLTGGVHDLRTYPLPGKKTGWNDVLSSIEIVKE